MKVLHSAAPWQTFCLLNIVNGPKENGNRIQAALSVHLHRRQNILLCVFLSYEQILPLELNLFELGLS